jgi:ATP-dependent Clp protease ATP-binding subunit ClpB
MILSGDVSDGESLRVSADGDGLTINGKPAGGRDSFSLSGGRAAAPPPGALLN